MRSQLIGSLGQDTQAAAERACLQSSSAHPNRESPLRDRGWVFFSPFCFPIASLPILCLSEQNVDLLTCNGGSNPF